MIAGLIVCFQSAAILQLLAEVGVVWPDSDPVSSTGSCRHVYLAGGNLDSSISAASMACKVHWE